MVDLDAAMELLAESPEPRLDTAMELVAAPEPEVYPTGGEYGEEYGDEAVEEITLESVGMLMGMIASQDEEARDEALAIMCELVGSCYGEDGMAVGATVREAGGPLTLSWLLSSPSVELQREPTAVELLCSSCKAAAEICD